MKSSSIIETTIKNRFEILPCYFFETSTVFWIVPTSLSRYLNFNFIIIIICFISLCILRMDSDQATGTAKETENVDDVVVDEKSSQNAALRLSVSSGKEIHNVNNLIQ